MKVAGVDGWRDGWVMVVLRNGRFFEAGVARTAAGLIDIAGDAEIIAVDIPIGLPAAGRRRADIEAKRRLGARSSSVFFAPPRPVVEAEPFAAANALAKERFGFGISRQSYGLRTKILEVDALDDTRLYEVHPELAFRELAGTVLPSKKTWGGVGGRRRALLEAGIKIPWDLESVQAVPVDDVLDAAAAAWSAHRIATGEAECVPARPERDATGRSMAIWF